MTSKLRKYIAEQPHTPNGFRYKTPILVSDSKGFTIRNACQDDKFPVESWCISGAQTSVLVDLIEKRISKAITRHHHIIIYLWSGTCDLTCKKGKYISLRHQNNKTVNCILDQYHRAIRIVAQHPRAEIKCIDCPILSIVNYNQYKGHDKPEIFKVEDFQVTRQIKALNSEIVKLNDSLNKKTINISKYFSRGRKIKRGGTRKSVNITINKKDGIHPGKLLSLAITKHILLDTYKECYQVVHESEIIQLHVEEEELLTLF